MSESLSTTLESIAISHDADVPEAARIAEALAREVGFPSSIVEEINLCVRELGTNILKHAGSGTMEVSGIQRGGRRGLQVDALDQGRGIPDVERVYADGFSTADSLGCGLGAVNRLSDEMEITSPRARGNGTRVTFRRWVRLRRDSSEICSVDYGVATRPRSGNKSNGDTFVFRKFDDSILVGAIDGVGHGRLAHRAAQTARAYIARHEDRPLGDLFVGVGRACRATRGVVMALARIDWVKKQMTFASVGNIESRLMSRREGRRFVVRRGILGLNAPSPLITEHPWPSGEVLVLHSDGLSSQWHFDDFPGLWNSQPDGIARRLLSKLGRLSDDATVIVVKEAAA